VKLWDEEVIDAVVAKAAIKNRDKALVAWADLLQLDQVVNVFARNAVTKLNTWSVNLVTSRNALNAALK
jgi:hypothetical protein